MLKIAVTGASGQLGRRISRRLGAAGLPHRVLVRDATRVPNLLYTQSMAADYGNADAVTKGLRGIETVLMVSAAETPQRVEQHRVFVQAAADAGVAHIVYTSFFGAAPDATFTLARDHWDTEQRIRSSGMAYTFLRDNVYADLFPFLAGEDGVLRGPAGRGRVAAVARDDIAEVAATVLGNPGEHAGATYDLTGPQALTLAEVADTLSAVTGRNVAYAPETVDEAYLSRRAYSDSQWQLDAWVSTYTAIAEGELDGATTTVADITGRPATTLGDLLRR